MRSNTKKIEKDMKPVSWNDKIKMKHRIKNQDKITCDITNISIDFNTTCIFISPTNTDIEKKIQLDSTIYPNKESNFEKFLKSIGISPTEDNLEQKITDKRVDLNARVEDNDVVFELDNIDHNSGTKLDEEINETQSRLDHKLNMIIATGGIASIIIVGSMMAPYMPTLLFSFITFMCVLSCVLYLNSEYGVFKDFGEN